MVWSEAQLLESVRKRAGRESGIMLASSYVKGLEACMGNQKCVETFLGQGSAAQWQQCVEKSSSVLVYTEAGMKVLGGRPIHDGRYHQSFGEGERSRRKRMTEPYPGAVLEFDCIITSTRKDHDGDVLDSQGGQLDPDMPLLMYHVPLLVAGRYVQLVSQNAKRIAGHFAVANTSLGQDAAVLVEFKALRISHGFRPLKMQPLEKPRKSDGDIDMEPTGWHITKFLVLETSLVSIPSNQDAVITAFSRDKLVHPLVKAHAKSLFDGRPTVVAVPGLTLKDVADVVAKTVKAVMTPPETKCGCKDNKDAVALDEDAVAKVAAALAKHPGKSPDYGCTFLHHQKAAVHYVLADGDELAVQTEAQKQFAAVPGVKSVEFSDEGQPPRGEGWRMVWPNKKDWKTGDVLEKCGGAGGAPGPCPAGGDPGLGASARAHRLTAEAAEAHQAARDARRTAVGKGTEEAHQAADEKFRQAADKNREAAAAHREAADHGKQGRSEYMDKPRQEESESLARHHDREAQKNSGEVGYRPGKSWAERVEAWKKQAVETGATISVDNLEQVCEACAMLARRKGLQKIKLAVLFKALGPAQLEGLCAKLSGKEHPFAECSDWEMDGIDDQDSFCAYLVHECLGKWPAEEGKGAKCGGPGGSPGPCPVGRRDSYRPGKSGESTMLVKSLRMTKSDLDSLADAKSHLKAVMGHDKTGEEAKALCMKGHDLIDEVHSRHAGAPDGDDEEKMLQAVLQVKGYGSKADVEKLTKSLEHMKAAHDSDDMHEAGHFLLNKSMSLVKGVVKRHTPDDDDDDDEDSELEEEREGKSNLAFQVKVGEVLGGLLQGKRCDLALLANLKDTVEMALKDAADGDPTTVENLGEHDHAAAYGMSSAAHEASSQSRQASARAKMTDLPADHEAAADAHEKAQKLHDDAAAAHHALDNHGVAEQHQAKSDAHAKMAQEHREAAQPEAVEV
jgi:hypothetical protein